MKKILLLTFFANYFIGMKYDMPPLSVILTVVSGIASLVVNLKELKKSKRKFD